MTPRFLRLAASSVVLLVAAGCAGNPKIRISWSRPPALQLAPNARVALIVEPDKNTPVADKVMTAAIGVTQGQVLQPSMAVAPLRDQFTAALGQAGYNVVGRADQPDVILRVTPTSWAYQLDLGDAKVGNLSAMPGGGGRAPSLTEGVGRLDIAVQAFDARGANTAPFYSDEYWARRNVKSLGEPEAMLRASQGLAELLLRELQPQRVSSLVTLDDSDPVTKPGIELCREGEFDAAFAAFNDAVRRNPRSAPAMYNLAVLLEARGRYDEAEDLLQRATQLESKAMYYTALQRMRGARQDAQAMNGE